MDQLNIHPIILKLLNKRGISAEQVNDFFSWELKALPDLTQMKDMDKAVERILKALSLNQKIGIYGDYDVDGTTSCALLYHFFGLLNVNVDVIQPSRFIEGYGVHNSSIDLALEKKIEVLITVDCGITSIETAEYAKGKLDLIITDHHQDAREKIPEAFAVINPNRRDEPQDSPLKTLAGVGVAFALALAIRNKLIQDDPTIPSIYPLLQFVAIGTICDMAKLDFMNLKLCRHGLKQLAQTQYKGLKAFLTQEEWGLPFIESEKISFQIGPMINSKGRIEHPEVAYKLLVANNDTEARELFNNLNQSNMERKFIQKNVFEEAKSLYLKEMKNDEPVAAILYSENFHEGVIGIVASKIVETFNVPAIIFTNTEDKSMIKASARACGDLNMFELLKAHEHLFVKFGGHKAAAGLSMKKEFFSEFKKSFCHLVKQIPPIVRQNNNLFDIEINLQDIDATLVRSLAQLEPFGMINEKPKFRINNFLLDTFTLMKENHVKWFLKSSEKDYRLQGVSFNYIGKWNTPSPEELLKIQKKFPLKADVTIGINRFRGNETIQLNVERIFSPII